MAEMHEETAQAAIEAGFFSAVANMLAEDVQAALVTRHIPLLRSDEEGVTAFRHVDRHVGGQPGVYQVTLLEAWPDSAPRIPAREFVLKYIQRWAANLAIKLARTGILMTYPMTLPKGVEAASLGVASDLVLRCVLDYSMHDDLKVLRVDALASWDE